MQALDRMYSTKHPLTTTDARHIPAAAVDAEEIF